MKDSIFKAYDIRGKYPDELDEQTVYKIAQAYAKLFSPKNVVLGRDVRLSGPALWEAAKSGFVDHGVNVIDLGVVTTDMFYFAAGALEADGGMTVTASHNPKEYNGLKIVKSGAVPVSGDSGINDIKQLVLDDYAFKADEPGNVSQRDVQKDYIEKCKTFVDVSKIKNLSVVANGMFGIVIQNVDALNLPIEVYKLNAEPDGNFPKGAPDPFLPENRLETEQAVREQKADLGVAWDADADRFFLFDETGRWVPGYYVSAFLAKLVCQKNRGAKILYDPRGTWAIIDSVEQADGVALVNKVGHSFIKERMRKEDALFSGEGSGHFYFRDFYYADNGLIPFLMILEAVSESGQKVSELFDEYFSKYPHSGEINHILESFDSAQTVLQKIESQYSDAQIDKIDGVSIEYPDWRANVRVSNTQPLVRLNAEAKTQDLLHKKIQELEKLF